MTPRQALYSLCILLSVAATLLPSAPAASAEAAIPITFYWENTWSFWTMDMRESWDSPLPKTVSIRGQDVSTCDQVMRALDGRPLTFAITREAEPLLTCAAVSLLGNLHPPRRVLFDPDGLPEDVYRHLDASTLPWSLTAALKRKGAYTFAEAGLRKPQPPDNSIGFIQGDASYVLNFLAMGDFQGNGDQSVYCEYKEIRKKGPRVLQGAALLVRKTKGGPIRAEPIVLRPAEYYKAPKSLYRTSDQRIPE